MKTTELVPDLLNGDRLDRVVAMVTGVTRSVAQELVTAGRVSVDGHVVVAKTAKVVAGALLEVDLVDEVEGAGALVAEADVEFAVVFQDEHLAVIDKPAGLVVHPGSGNQTGTLVHGLLARFPELASVAVGDRADRPGIVHRLDRGTSGLLVVARSSECTDRLIAKMSRREVSRKYLALARGAVESDNGLVDAPIGRSDKDPTRMIVTSKGREARTSYRVLDRFTMPEPCTYVECTLDTGRTHQIRVHLAAIGHAICGDPRYGGKRGAIDCPRPFLHAYQLSFTHPFTDEELSFQSELPADLVTVLASID